MEKEIVIRDPDNKRIRKMIKVDISEEIQYECQRNMEVILFEQSQQISQFFSLLDAKQSWGIISELTSAALGIDEYENNKEKQFQRYSAQYQSCYDKLNYGLLNISSQLLFALKKIPNEYLDQKFIKYTVGAIISLQEKYINNEKNNILPVQKEILNGIIKKIVEMYNKKLDDTILLCKQNNSWRSKLVGFAKLLENNHWLDACTNILVYSENQNQFMQHLQDNKLNIRFSELKKTGHILAQEIPNTEFCIEYPKNEEERKKKLKKIEEETEYNRKHPDTNNQDFAPNNY